MSAVIEELREVLNTKPQTVEDIRGQFAEIARAKALKTKFDNLIRTEIIQRPELIKIGTDKSRGGSGNVTSDGDAEQNSSGGYIDGPVRLPVLTLYGGGPQPKQLFSSLQQPSRTESRASITPEVFREEALPNGIFASKIVPVQSTEISKEKKNVPTLGELFPSPLPPLNPPRQSRPTGTRSSSVNWVKASEPTSSNNTYRKTYPLQPLATSQWLTYNTAPSPAQHPSPQERRRQRDRALSFGEPQPPLISAASLAAHSEVKEDALFRSAYSSFAPDRDSTGSIVPDHSKESIWWRQTGESRHWHSRQGGMNGVRKELDMVPQLDDVPDDELLDAVQKWTPVELPRELMETKDLARKAPGSISEMDTLIDDISELLETLNSYQRARNLSLTNTALTTANPELIALSGSPVTPSTAEFDVYSMLESQLALIISSLPPSAVTRLGGNRLGSLNVTSNIPIEGKSYTGTMEDDELLSKARAISTSSAVGYPSRTPSISSALPARVNGYTHPSTPTQAIPRSTPAPVSRAANTTPQLPNQQYSSRPASSNHYFNGTAHSSFPPQRSASTTAERYSHAKPPQYGQRPAPPQHTPFPNGYRAYPNQNGPPYNQQQATAHHGLLSPATTESTSQTQRPSRPGYQQRAMNALSYPFGSSTPGREPSPSKNRVLPPRLPPTTPGPMPGQVRPPVYHPQSQHPAAQNAAELSVNGTGGSGSGSGSVAPSIPPTHLTRAEQEALMNLQKVRLAQHDGRSRQGSDTPQPASGSHGAGPNRPAASQPNGV